MNQLFKMQIYPTLKNAPETISLLYELFQLEGMFF